MKMLNKFKKKETKDIMDIERDSVFKNGYEINKSDFRELLSATVAKVMTIQEHVGEYIVQDNGWMEI